MSARRYVELNEYACAVIFSKDNTVRYTLRSEFFEHFLCVRKGDSLPSKSSSRNASGNVDDWDEIEGYWWISDERSNDCPDTIYEQTLRQDSGFKITLLAYD